MAEPLVLIPHLFRLAGVINFRKDYSPPLVRHLNHTCFIWVLHMFHAYVWKCFIRMLHMFHTYVASVSSGCCICSTIATHVFPWCFIHMLQVFQLIRMYVASVSSKCCKSRYDVAHVAVKPTCSSHLL